MTGRDQVLAGFLVAVVVGAVSGAAAVLVHQAWWGLALGLTAALVTLAWLPAGPLRLGFAAGWLLVVSRAALTLPAGDYLIASDAARVVVPGRVAGARGRRAGDARSTVGGRPARADDQGVRGSAT